jgi:hypothetical protein
MDAIWRQRRGYGYNFRVAYSRARDYRECMLRIILNKKPVFWILLSLPAILMLRSFYAGDRIAMDMLHPTGEWLSLIHI